MDGANMGFSEDGSCEVECPKADERLQFPRIEINNEILRKYSRAAEVGILQ